MGQNLDEFIRLAEEESHTPVVSNADPTAVQVLKVLSEKAKKHVLSDENQPFASTEEYVEFLVILDQLRSTAQTGSTALEQPLLTKMVKDSIDCAPALSLREIYRELVSAMEQKKEKKLQITDPKPRLERYLDKLDLTLKERRVMESLVSSTSQNQSAEILAEKVKMNLFERANFLDVTRPHMKENFFEYIDPNRPFEAALELQYNFHLALLEVPLTEEHLLRFDGTILNQILEEEKKNESQEKKEVDTPPEDIQPTEAKQVHDDIIETDLHHDPSPPPTTEPPTDTHIDTSKRQVSFEEDPFDFSKLKSEEAAPPSAEASTTSDGENLDDIPIAAYRNDLDYLQTEAKRIASLFQLSTIEQSIERDKASSWRDMHADVQQQVKCRTTKAQSKTIARKCQVRLDMTREAGPWQPRLERLCQLRGLDEFERNVVLCLVSASFSPTIQNLGYSNLNVGHLIRTFKKKMADQIKHRKYFYKNSKLIKDGIILIIGGSALDVNLLHASVKLDRRMSEFIMGIDSEFSELVEGSHLYLPKVKLEQVVLSAEVKKLILSTVENFDSFKRARKRMGFEETLTYGSGIVMLFFGASGTGKTMVANAIANHMNKRLLLINFPSLGKMSAGESLKFIFREAKINDAILFFDECESIFESREFGSSDVNTLLTEIERHDGLVIMATNRAYDLDEAMHRRITLAIEFIKPDPILRESIWRNNIPSGMKLADDVILSDLAMNFELTGGLIKNAILSALSMSVSRDGEKEATVRQEDFEAGARLQLRGRLRMIDFEHRVVPTQGLESLVLSKAKLEQLQSVVEYEKARQILYGQWGFDKIMGQDKANSVLFWGPPGTGKTLAAEAVAFSTGKPLKFVNTGELVSKWVGDTGKNINSIFEEAQANDAVLFFDEADAIFGRRTAVVTSTDKYSNQGTGLLLYHMEHYKGIVILSSNLISEIDPAFFRRIKFVVEFEIPAAAERVSLWRKLIPKECPLDASVKLGDLANRYNFSGGQIKSCVIRAATRAALRSRREGQKDVGILQSELEAACKEELEKDGRGANAGFYTRGPDRDKDPPVGVFQLLLYSSETVKGPLNLDRMASDTLKQAKSPVQHEQLLCHQELHPDHFHPEWPAARPFEPLTRSTYPNARMLFDESCENRLLLDFDQRTALLQDSRNETYWSLKNVNTPYWYSPEFTSSCQMCVGTLCLNDPSLRAEDCSLRLNPTGQMVISDIGGSYYSTPRIQNISVVSTLGGPLSINMYKTLQPLNTTWTNLTCRIDQVYVSGCSGNLSHPQVTAPRGTGSDHVVEICMSRRDPYYSQFDFQCVKAKFSYRPPIIYFAYTSGNALYVNGKNFGNDISRVNLTINGVQCLDAEFIGEGYLMCHPRFFGRYISIKVDGQSALFDQMNPPSGVQTEFDPLTESSIPSSSTSSTTTTIASAPGTTTSHPIDTTPLSFCSGRGYPDALQTACSCFSGFTGQRCERRPVSGCLSRAVSRESTNFEPALTFTTNANDVSFQVTAATEDSPFVRPSDDDLLRNDTESFSTSTNFRFTGAEGAECEYPGNYWAAREAWLCQDNITATIPYDVLFSRCGFSLIREDSYDVYRGELTMSRDYRLANDVSPIGRTESASIKLSFSFPREVPVESSVVFPDVRSAASISSVNYISSISSWSINITSIAQKGFYLQTEGPDNITAPYQSRLFSLSNLTDCIYDKDGNCLQSRQLLISGCMPLTSLGLRFLVKVCNIYGCSSAQPFGINVNTGSACPISTVIPLSGVMKSFRNRELTQESQAFGPSDTAYFGVNIVSTAAISSVSISKICIRDTVICPSLLQISGGGNYAAAAGIDLSTISDGLAGNYTAVATVTVSYSGLDRKRTEEIVTEELLLSFQVKATATTASQGGDGQASPVSSGYNIVPSILFFIVLTSLLW
ncbi:hypothetical protein PROFUN_07405 [Planoprotostelium fungivorum]|uniref:EGF-like domain-containing protein n=1 Tax=Planoprotostelium fungivorum TaxID=1890364 RepID=A0A2P6MTH3_9EUKA|nr:hypothetical protein PROFUN_07405 [Planoprotostelium fungivorum]